MISHVRLNLGMGLVLNGRLSGRRRDTGPNATIFVLPWYFDVRATFSRAARLETAGAPARLISVERGQVPLEVRVV